MVNHAMESRQGACQWHGEHLEPAEAFDQGNLHQRYVDGQAFRFNERKKDDSNRFREVVSSVTGKRPAYSELTGHETAKA